MTVLWDSVIADTGLPAYRFATRRSVPPRLTLRRLEPLLPLAGITRLADVTGLDWIGMPVYQAIRPNSRNLSVAQGKGLTADQAKVSALMESLESFHAEEIKQASRREAVGSMQRELDYDPFSLSVVREPTEDAIDAGYDPYAPPVGRPSRLRDTSVVDWIKATDLCSGRSTWVPRQLGELNFCVEERLILPLFRATSNGLASGNTFSEALVHGLCEVVERDALWRQRGRPINPATIDSGMARGLIDRFEKAGMHTDILDNSGSTGLPCFQVLLGHAESSAWYDGSGCSTSRATALVRALTEAAQSRLSHIAGSRDDFVRRTYTTPRLTAPSNGAAGSTKKPSGRFGDAPTLSLAPLGETVRTIADRVRSVTGMAPLAVDLARPEFDLPVVLVIAPGLGLEPPRRQ